MAHLSLSAAPAADPPTGDLARERHGTGQATSLNPLSVEVFSPAKVQKGESNLSSTSQLANLITSRLAQSPSDTAVRAALPSRSSEVNLASPRRPAWHGRAVLDPPGSDDERMPRTGLHVGRE